MKDKKIRLKKDFPSFEKRNRFYKSFSFRKLYIKYSDLG